MSYFASNHFESNYFASNLFAGANALLDEGGGGMSSKRKRGEGWGREREIHELSLRPQPKPTPAVEPQRVPTPQKEVAGGQELLREAEQLRASINSLKAQYLAGQISKMELESAIKRKNQALEVIFMALELDKRIAYEIIM